MSDKPKFVYRFVYRLEGGGGVKIDAKLVCKMTGIVKIVYDRCHVIIHVLFTTDVIIHVFLKSVYYFFVEKNS